MWFCTKGQRSHLLVSTSEHIINDVHKLHDPLIKVEVFKAFEEVGVFAAIRTYHRDLLWFGFSWKDGYFEIKGF